MEQDSPHNECVRSQKPVRNTFRRPRAGRACGSCHSKRVRCDAGIRGLPCTNCAAFSLDCSIPPKKKEREAETVGGLKRIRPRRRNFIQENSSPRESSSSPEPEYTSNYAKLIKPEVANSTIQDAGSVFYLSEMSGMSVLLHDYDYTTSKVHYQFPSDWERRDLASTGTDEIEVGILRVRGALSLPPKEICDVLVNAFFTWVAPIVPIINKTSFIKRYHDPNNPPSILLMQAILLAGSRVCPISSLTYNGTQSSSATLFYQRAKALYDADYEKDRVIMVQSLVLLGWYWEDPGKVTKNVFYWNGLAISIAHGFGMHRSAKESNLSVEDKRLWKRIWWTLFTRDRAVAAALGRTVHINTRDSDVEIITEDDFIEDGGQMNQVHVQFFLSYVRLSQVVDKIMVDNYSTTSNPSAVVFTKCEQALSDWLQGCPAEVRWDVERYNFWSAYLHCIYQTASCLLYRAYLPTSISRLPTTPRWSPAFKSAEIITSIVRKLMANDELQFTPPFMIYTLLSALIIQIYQLRKRSPLSSEAIKEEIFTCMQALEQVAKTWLVATMVHKLFENILGWCIPDAPPQETLEPSGFGISVSASVSDVGAQTTEESALLSGERKEDERLEIGENKLTPGLKDFMEAALGPIKVYMSKSAQSPEPAGRAAETGLHFLPEDEELEWDQERIRTPTSTGLNPELWSEFFGYNEVKGPTAVDLTDNRLLSNESLRL